VTLKRYTDASGRVVVQLVRCPFCDSDIGPEDGPPRVVKGPNPAIPIRRTGIRSTVDEPTSVLNVMTEVDSSKRLL